MSSITYYSIEKPSIQIGRKLSGLKLKQLINGINNKAG
ncbi:hypothetical protein bthur0007_57880 [Bacillus thuringiensis serovar monterrey BGSC 4AJ1]|nr:hypothetical protein bthur0007_57880 [Bacillus thuringiensis serovar monterrey BGSC 4AJ1]EEM86637.1 hypothetical protein bthur0012_53220 [Bacillus thuringiensis serovar pulsiensis BGSC 4CC1]